MKNQIALLTGPRSFEIVDAPMPVVGPNDVLIKSCHVGVCGSDVEFYLDPTFHGRFHPDKPFVLGHEVGGIIIDKGSNVDNVNIGDVVAVEPGEPCGKCDYCLKGQYNLCNKMNFMATAPFERGALCRYFSFPAHMVFSLPKNLTTLDGAMMEPFAVGMYAAKRGNVTFDKTVLILGSGCIGLMILFACRICGARNIIVADIMENRLQTAIEKGASCVINTSKEDLIESVMRLTDGKGADVVFEAAGSPVTTEATTQVVKKHGCIVLAASPKDPAPLDLLVLCRKEADILGMFRYVNLYPTIRDVLATSDINISSIVTHRYPFENVRDAFEHAAFDKEHVVKAVVEFN